jgi:hypothetical protein
MAMEYGPAPPPAGQSSWPLPENDVEDGSNSASSPVSLSVMMRSQYSCGSPPGGFGCVVPPSCSG